MPTISDLKLAVANMFNVALTDLTVNGQDIFMFALNQVRRQAELNHDFEFQRNLVKVSVDGTTGGSLVNAVLYSDGVTGVNVKSVIEVGLFDNMKNLRPVEWTTVAEGLERQRSEERFGQPLWRRDTECHDQDASYWWNFGRFVVTGNQIFHFPKTTVDTYVLGLEVYAFSPDWLGSGNYLVGVSGADDTGEPSWNYSYFGQFNGMPVYTSNLLTATGNGVGYLNDLYYLWNDGTQWILCSSAYFLYPNGTTPTDYYSLAGTASIPDGTYVPQGTFTSTPNVETELPTYSNDPWLTYGYQYLQWAVIVQLNHLFKSFVFRQEGNLPPPEKLRDDGLAAFIAWDAFRYEQNRRHDR